MSDIADAIYVAAGADDPALRRLINPRSVVSERRCAAARNIIRRFLENVPDGATAMELLREIEDAPAHDA